MPRRHRHSGAQPMFGTSWGTSNTETPVSASASGQNAATQHGAFFTATPQPTAGSSGLFGGSTSASSGSIFGAAPAVGNSGTSPFGSTKPSIGRGFGSGGSLFGPPAAGLTSNAILVDANPSSMTTGTATQAYSVFSEKDPSNLTAILQYQSITAAPAYREASAEELRAQDYQQDRRGSANQTSSGAPAMSPSIFGRPATTPQPELGSQFGGGTTGAFASTGGFGFGQPLTAGTGISGNTSALGRPSLTLDPGKLEGIEELLRKFLLGEELVNTQFHLFSARSSASGRVMKPRVVCANNDLLAKSSKYFLHLLSTDIDPSDTSLVDVMGDNDIPSDAPIHGYGYESDSDLDDCDDPSVVTNVVVPKDRSGASPATLSKVGVETKHKNGNGRGNASSDDSSDDSDTDGSDAFVVTLGQPGTEKPLSGNKAGVKSVLSVDKGKQKLGNEAAMHLRSLGRRHVLVKDTAFQTWYTLLNYLHTGKFSFLPLGSTTYGGQRESFTSSGDGPRCSAKSMYRLASKVGLDRLREEALAHIRSNLTEHNILKELSSTLLSKYPELREMELDVLYSHIASPPVVENFAVFAERIAHNELPHGKDIIVGVHMRLLKKHHPFSLITTASALLPGSSGQSASVKQIASASDPPAAGEKRETGPADVDNGSARSGSLSSGGGDSVPEDSDAEEDKELEVRYD